MQGIEYELHCPVLSEERRDPKKIDVLTNKKIYPV
jgi:hypothetical protein